MVITQAFRPTLSYWLPLAALVGLPLLLIALASQ